MEYKAEQMEYAAERGIQGRLDRNMQKRGDYKEE
jgi:hypothetical protein